MLSYNNLVESSKDSSGWVLRFEEGERLQPSFTEFLAKNHCSGWIGGIGGAHDPELSYFNLETRSHEPRVLPGFYEVLSISGFVALSEENEPVMHLHGTFGDEHHRSFGGHLFDLTTSPTLVIFICRIARTLRLKADPITGVPLLDLKPR